MANTITFQTDSIGRYVGVVSVSKDFNLHLELTEPCEINILRKTAGVEYARVADFYGKAVVDTDFNFLSYPKSIKVITSKQPSLCVITESNEASSSTDAPVEGDASNIVNDITII